MPIGQQFELNGTMRISLRRAAAGAAVTVINPAAQTKTVVLVRLRVCCRVRAFMHGAQIGVFHYTTSLFYLRYKYILGYKYNIYKRFLQLTISPKLLQII